MKKACSSLALVAATVLASGCASVQHPNPADPLEGFNRQVFKFNDGLDRAVMQPVAKSYKWAVPQPARDMVTNFFSNMGDVKNLANNLLQGKITAATQDLMRLAMNSFLGIGGLVDFATPAGLPKHEEDFGQTLGVWGVPSGPYLVLPLFGPSTLRDAPAMVADMEISPTAYIDPVWVRNSLYGVNVVNTRANLLGATDLLSQAALDKYSFTRDAYLQRRKYLISGGNASEQSLPQYDDVGAGAAPAAPAGASSAGAAAAPRLPAGTGSNPVPPSHAIPELNPFHR